MRAGKAVQDDDFRLEKEAFRRSVIEDPSFLVQNRRMDQKQENLHFNFKFNFKYKNKNKKS